VLLSSDDLAWNFRVFALIAVAGALIIAFVPKSPVAGPAPGNAPPRGAIESVT
jgi:hypothetical protein